MLYSATRLDDSAVVEKQHRRLAIAPLSPARQPREHLAHSGDEVLALDQVEGVLEVDLEQSELRVLALADNIAEGVGDDFHSPLAANSEVAAFEVLADLFPGHHAEAFAYEAPKRIAARQRSYRYLVLLEGYGHTACQNALQELGGFACREVVHRTRDCSLEC